MGPAARFAGTRTFLLIGLIGGSAGLLLDSSHEVAASALLAGTAALAVVAYVVAAGRGGDDATDGTTEAAALAVLGLATLAGTGSLGVAAASGAVMVLALREKGAIHGFVRKIEELELRAAVQFAVLALVLLPILPVGPYGPLGGIRPRELWAVVLIVSGLNFAGYIARRVVGLHRGTTIAGLFGGLVSSTAVTLTFARRSREHPAEATPLALGVIGASTVLLPRVFGLTLALRPALAEALVPYFLPPLLAGVTMIVAGLRRTGTAEPEDAVVPETRNPLRLGSAIVLALGFQAVLMFMAFVRDRFGEVGVLASAAMVGLTDTDALTLSMTRLAAEPEVLHLAALALAVGVLSNTAFKLVSALVLGSGPFRTRVGLGLLLLGLCTVFGVWLAQG